MNNEYLFFIYNLFIIFIFFLYFLFIFYNINKNQVPQELEYIFIYFGGGIYYIIILLKV
jgi:hypothetical protein